MLFDPYGLGLGLYLFEVIRVLDDTGVFNQSIFLQFQRHKEFLTYGIRAMDLPFAAGFETKSGIELGFTQDKKGRVGGAPTDAQALIHKCGSNTHVLMVWAHAKGRQSQHIYQAFGALNMDA
jgi:hypothetical protein